MAVPGKASDFSSQSQPTDTMGQFVDLFTAKGWLNQNLRIRYRGKKYRILCSRKTFIAYRINENYGISPGMPGWAVCIVNQNQIFEDARMPNPAVGEPTAGDWLRCLSDGDFEVI